MVTTQAWYHVHLYPPQKKTLTDITSDLADLRSMSQTWGHTRGTPWNSLSNDQRFDGNFPTNHWVFLTQWAPGEPQAHPNVPGKRLQQKVQEILEAQLIPTVQYSWCACRKLGNAQPDRLQLLRMTVRSCRNRLHSSLILLTSLSILFGAERVRFQTMQTTETFWETWNKMK